MCESLYVCVCVCVCVCACDFYGAIFLQRREKMLKKDKHIGHVTTHETSSLHDVAVLNQLRTTNFKWQRGRKLGELKLHITVHVHACSSEIESACLVLRSSYIIYV